MESGSQGATESGFDSPQGAQGFTEFGFGLSASGCRIGVFDGPRAGSWSDMAPEWLF